MKLLALDCSNQLGSVAIIDGNGITHAEICRKTERHARVILPMVERLLAKHDLRLTDFEAIACCRGPGSFTGVRIGMSIVKGLAYALNVPVRPVSSLHSIAYRTWKLHGCNSVISIIDARMNEVYWSHGVVYSDRVEDVSEECVSSVDELVEYVSCLEVKPDVIAGVGMSEHPGLNRLSLPLHEVAVHAESMLQLALSITPVDALMVEPVYIRNQVIQVS